MTSSTRLGARDSSQKYHARTGGLVPFTDSQVKVLDSEDGKVSLGTQRSVLCKVGGSFVTCKVGGVISLCLTECLNCERRNEDGWQQDRSQNPPSDLHIGLR
jgi:hypothetical protein